MTKLFMANDASWFVRDWKGSFAEVDMVEQVFNARYTWLNACVTDHTSVAYSPCANIYPQIHHVRRSMPDEGCWWNFVSLCNQL